MPRIDRQHVTHSTNHTQNNATLSQHQQQQESYQQPPRTSFTLLRSRRQSQPISASSSSASVTSGTSDNEKLFADNANSATHLVNSQNTGGGNHEKPWTAYPTNLRSYVPIIDYTVGQDVFFTYKSLFSHTSTVDIFEIRDDSPQYYKNMKDHDLDAILNSAPTRPPTYVRFHPEELHADLPSTASNVQSKFIDRLDSAGVVGGGKYTMNVDMMKRAFSYHEVPMDFIQEHSREGEMFWPSETRQLMNAAGNQDAKSFEFWYNAKLRTKRLSGKGEETVKQMAVYHKKLADKEMTVIYCIGADETIKSRFRSLRGDASSFDVFSVHLVFLERLLDCYSEESWNVREIVNILTFNQSPQGLLSDPQLSRYMHRKAEVSSILEHELDLLAEVINCVRRHHKLHTDNGENYTSHRIDQRLVAMANTTQCLKRWCQKCHVMMQGQLSLAYSSISQADSRANIQIALLAQKDSHQMRIISFVTILFLPPTAVATIFGTNFFQFSPTSGIQTSGKIWIFFVSTIVVTILIYLVWIAWRWYDKPKPLDEDLNDSNGTTHRGGDGHDDEDMLHHSLGGSYGGGGGNFLRYDGKGVLRSFTAQDLAGGRI